MRRTSGNVATYSAAAQAGVLQMRLDEAAKLQPVQPLPPAIDASLLTSMQQAALLTMTESHVKRAVIARLLEDAQDAPAMPDYRALSRLGLARYSGGKRLHELTAEGRIAARDLERKLCGQFDIHLMLGPMGAGPEVSFSCPCGWRVSVRNSHTAPGNARVSFNRHHATAAGMSKLVVALKPLVRMEG